MISEYKVLGEPLSNVLQPSPSQEYSVLSILIAMPPRKELSTDLKDAIVHHFEKGNSYTKVSTTFGVPRSTVQGVITHWKALRMNINVPQKGHP